MSRLISATILPEPTIAGEVGVQFVWETALIARKDWRALHQALEAKHIPTRRYTEIRHFSSQELAERAIRALGGKVDA